ncbi:uncharacterized protein LOC134240097 [Saccostrea cucullata]|uniref:uncharacterized protein LOC134240097 n=1 Tax=Saccostrea cuccullata TaxID=36930 RepID=UPI002ED0DB57
MESSVRIGCIFLLVVFVGVCHGKYCYYDGNIWAYYCESQCSEGASVVGGAVGGVLAVAIVIGITVCVSVHLKFKQHENRTHQNNGAIPHRPNTLSPLHAQNSSHVPPPPAYMYQEPTRAHHSGTPGHM